MTENVGLYRRQCSLTKRCEALAVTRKEYEKLQHAPDVERATETPKKGTYDRGLMVRALDCWAGSLLLARSVTDFFNIVGERHPLSEY